MASPSSTSTPPPTTTHLLALPPPSSHTQSPPTTSSPNLHPCTTVVTTISPPKKPQPLPWTNQETVNLIQSYQEKWYSLKRGQLKASQWEEVSISVAARCGFDEPTKTSTQCRHKMEKLRKRYRAERVKPYPNSWQFFQLMDNMERGPFPLSAVAQPVSSVKMVPRASNPVSNLGKFDRDHGDDSDDNEFRNGVDNVRKIKSKSINNILRGGVGAVYGRNDCNGNGSSGGGGGGIYIGNGRRIPVFGGGGDDRGMMPNMVRESSMMNSRKRKGHYEDSDDNDDDEEDEDVDVDGDGDGDADDEMGAGDGGKELAAEIRGFAERFMRVEKMKIEMMRETERYRMELERTRMEMIVDSQRKIVDSISRAFRAHKKLNTGQEL